MLIPEHGNGEEEFRAIEFYSGIGGLHLALATSLVKGRVVRAFDWDQTACKVYEANYGPHVVQKADISKLSAIDLAQLKANMWLLSPSCQPYTVLNPLAKGAEDPRAKSFIHLVEDVLPELTKMGQEPRYILIENVAGFETSSTRQRVLHTLDSLAYNTMEFLLTPLQFGIPNSRLRYYLLAKRRPMSFPDIQGSIAEQNVWRRIPGGGADWSDPRSSIDTTTTSEATGEVREYLDHDPSEDDCQIPHRVLEKWGRLFDIVLPTARRTCCFTRGYTKLAERAGSVLQLNEDLDTTTIFDTFLESQKEGNVDAIRLLEPLRLRYFSPSELLRLFCFESPSSDHPGFEWPEGISTKTKYKLIGNSVNVEVVRHLINYLLA